MKSKMPTKPIYSGIIALRTEVGPERFDRLTRKDFWNDPDRWEGIEDPSKTMIWEVRRPDRIVVAPRNSAANPDIGALDRLASAPPHIAMRNDAYHRPIQGGLYSYRHPSGLNNLFCSLLGWY